MFENDRRRGAVRESIDTGIPPSKSPLEWAVQADGRLYTALIATLPDGSIEPGDITAQTTRTMDNLKQVMAAAGGSMADVTQVLIYLTDGADAPAMNAVYRTYFDPPYPNRATVVVSALLAPGAIIEIVAHAHIGSAGIST
jgi:2-iminobutanoate/2-iminopropanoate deaminase